MTEEQFSNLQKDSNYYYDLLLEIGNDTIAYNLELDELSKFEE